MKFFDNKHIVLLECGNKFTIYDQEKIRPEIAVVEIKLEENEKLIGIRSNASKF